MICIRVTTILKADDLNGGDNKADEKRNNRTRRPYKRDNDVYDKKVLDNWQSVFLLLHSSLHQGLALANIGGDGRHRILLSDGGDGASGQFDLVLTGQGHILCGVRVKLRIDLGVLGHRLQIIRLSGDVSFHGNSA